MTMLRELQHELQACVLREANAAARHVLGTERLSAADRLCVYADAYRIRLRESLEDDFKALRAWLAPERFAELAHAYIAAHQSTHYSLRWFGRHLPRFLAAAPDHRETPVLAELAAFEWALGLAFDAPDAPPLSRAALRAVAPAAWPSLRFDVHPSVVRLDLAWNAPAIRRAVDAAAALPVAVEAAAPVAWIIWRHDHETYFRSLEADEADAFDRLRREAAFADVCAELARRGAPAAARASALLERWIGDGVLSGFAGQPGP